MDASILNQIICRMSANRPFFYSEADFQHNLANELRIAGYTVYLEYQVCGFHIDIIIEDDGRYYPLELKYKTSLTKCPDLFMNATTLRNHGASDIARFLFWRDVYRIEQIKPMAREIIPEGYVVMLTNDKKLWTPKVQKGIDRKFELFTSHQINTVEWLNTADAPDYKTGNTWYKAFSLSKTYSVPAWNNYSNVSFVANIKKAYFKFLTITV